METRPRWATPRNPERRTIAHEVIGCVGLLGWERGPMPWQRELLETAFEVDAFGQLWYSEIVVVVPRQSGKSTIIIPWGVHRMIMWPDRQFLLYITQKREDALRMLTKEHFYRISRSPIEALLVPNRNGNKLHLSNGSERMEFVNGSQWTIDAPKKESGHGQTLGLTIGDEIFAQKDDRLEQALAPTTATIDDAQSLWISTAGESKTLSPFLWGKVEAGRARVEAIRADPSLLNRYRTLYVEYSAPEDADPDDPLTWWGCMPALGYTQTIRKITGFRDSMGGGFVRPFLNWWADDQESEWKIPRARWEAVADPDSEATADEVVYVIDVSPDSAWASIAAAGVRSDGAVHLEVLADAPRVLDYDKPGEDWLLYGDRERDIPGILDLVRVADGPVYVEHHTAGFLVPALAEAGIDVRVMTSADIQVSGPGLLDAVLNRAVYHPGQDEVTEALKAAAVKVTGDGWRWIRGKSMRPIPALVAITYAHHMLTKLLPELKYDPLAAFRDANGIAKEAS